MKKELRVLLILMVVTLIFVTCSTDFELNVPEETTIVYGIIDQAADTQWIKVNKSFLGDGNNYDYAAINDCTEYNNISVTVEENNSGMTWLLNEKYVPVDNNSGIYYTDSQKVYYFIPDSLDKTSTYTVKVQFDDNRPVVESTTSLIGTFDFATLFKYQLISGVEFENGTGLSNSNYVDNFKIEWSLGKDAKRYDLNLRFHYVEHYTSGGSADKYIDWYQGSQEASSASGIGQLDRVVNGELFYEYLGNLDQLKDVSNVEKRVAGNIEFMLIASHEELSTFIEINEPVSGIVTERPTYTNITNGIGIFSASARVILERPSSLHPFIKFKKNSVQELSLGQYTNGLLFCSDSAAYSAESFYCP
ncbi:DUF4249 family protein [Flavobacteriales bacterium]|nr:DUF4249 family protein [Flavobacteriales bacterium]